MSKQRFTRSNVPSSPIRTAEVSLPSFSEEGEEPLVALVREMTVANKNLLSVYTTQGHDPMSVMAALTAVDDNGRLVFGETPHEAIKTVSNLPERYRLDIAAIAMKSLELSGRETETAVEDAKKN
jgi:hypothetical protein